MIVNLGINFWQMNLFEMNLFEIKGEQKVKKEREIIIILIIKIVRSNKLVFQIYEIIN